MAQPFTLAMHGFDGVRHDPQRGVLWRKVGSTRVRYDDAGNGQDLLAHLASLSADSKYEYIVEETDGSQTLRSSIRTLNVESGLAFDPVIGLAKMPNREGARKNA
jgi:hypothetical protein